MIALLAAAKDYFAQGRLDSPKGENAVAAYRAVLALDAKNQAALAGLDSLAGDYATLAKSAHAKG